LNWARGRTLRPRDSTPKGRGGSAVPPVLAGSRPALPSQRRRPPAPEEDRDGPLVALRSRASAPGRSRARRARELERQGRDIVHLEIGEPDFETPPHVAEAGIAAIRAGQTHYCQTAGLPELRATAAAYLSRTRGISLDPDSVLVANGAKPFLFFTVLATCGPGDEVIYPDPGFPIYESAIRFAGATPVPLPLHEERSFSVDPAELDRLLGERTRLVILNTPQNPTGGVIPADHEAASRSILRTPAWVLSDEVYARITYDTPAPSIASLPGMLERTILLDGFSKTYAMTGWRLGYAAVPEPLVDPLTRLIVNSTSCVPPFVQLAGVARTGGVPPRRDFLVPALNGIPEFVREPQGRSTPSQHGALPLSPTTSPTGYRGGVAPSPKRPHIQGMRSRTARSRAWSARTIAAFVDLVNLGPRAGIPRPRRRPGTAG
jgi:aspartate/methionine/tyrosine aminotransferase